MEEEKRKTWRVTTLRGKRGKTIRGRKWAEEEEKEEEEEEEEKKEEEEEKEESAREWESREDKGE